MSDSSPLHKLQQDLLDGSVSTTRMLQNCMLLAGAAGSTELRTWARRELEGYPASVDLPDRRKIVAQLYVDGQNGNWLFKEQGIGPEDLPDFVQDAGVGNEVPLRQGLAEIEALAEGDAMFVHLSLPGGETIKKAMNHELRKTDPYAQVHRVYWSASRAVFRGVVEGVRTALADLISELVRILPPNQAVPSKEQADQAVHFTVTGESASIHFNNSQATGGSTSTATLSSAPPENETWWRRWRKRGIVVGLIGMAGATAGVLNWLQFYPFS